MFAPAPATEGNAWTIQSNTRDTKLASAGFAALGCLFLWLTSRLPSSAEDTGVLAAFWLGVLLLAIGAGVFLFIEDVVLSIDEARKTLTVTRQSRAGTHVSSLGFADVGSVDVASIGRSHRGVVTHHLVLVMKSGKRVPANRWSVDHSEIVALAERLSRALGCPLHVERSYNPVDFKMLAVSAAGAALAYVAYYAMTVGPVCKAMWLGTLPALFIPIAFFILFRLLRHRF